MEFGGGGRWRGGGGRWLQWLWWVDAVNRNRRIRITREHPPTPIPPERIKRNLRSNNPSKISIFETEVINHNQKEKVNWQMIEM